MYENIYEMKHFRIVNGHLNTNKIDLNEKIGAHEILNSLHSITTNSSLNGIVAFFSENNIRISNINLNYEIDLDIDGEKTVLKIFVLKNNTKYQLTNIKSQFNDYYIDNQVFHCIQPSIIEINQIIREFNLDPNDLTFPSYVLLVKKLKEKNISFKNSTENIVNFKKKIQTSFNIEGIQFPLYKYQTEGCNWLNYMVEKKCGAILGDEMGLGKTLQIISLIGYQKQQNNDSCQCLIVCPISLLENWFREIRKFLPSLKALLHYGSNRTGYYQQFLEYDVIITAYSSVVSDQAMLNMINWDMVILDEAQNIKNPNAKRTKMVKKIQRKIGIAVTGTLFENHFTDVWSVADFVLPTYLGSLEEFENKFQDDNDSAVQIEKMISPIMIRRTVLEVADELPEKVIIPQPIIMSENEAGLYERQRSEAENLIMVNKFNLATIQKLRMFCTHPCVYEDAYLNVNPIIVSRKYERTIEILREIFLNKEKVIIFTSFTKMIELFIADIKSRFGGYVNYINGTITAANRQLIIDEYSKEAGFGVLIINPKAGGVGLNITAANHVIHYNLEWNPAIEDQATARAYRRGQTKTVFVYRLFYSNTIEEIINEKIERKRELSNLSIVGNIGNADENDLIRAYKISPI
jgi:SNF2 family DNA or RNA helicase